MQCSAFRFRYLTRELSRNYDEFGCLSVQEGQQQITPQQVAADMFQKAAEACVINLQNIIEGLTHNLQKQAAKRAATAVNYSRMCI